MKPMNSAFVSTILTRALSVFLILILPIIPWMMGLYNDYQVNYYGQKSIIVQLIVLGYSACLVGIVALFSLDKLLRNIRKGEVFIHSNIQIIRALSYLCFAECLIFGVFGFIRPLSFMVAAAAAFLGLIVRVVKNTFDIATEIKEENEYTI